MIGVLIFSAIIVVLTIGFRFFGSRYYDKIYGKPAEQANQPLVNQIPTSEDSDDELIAVISAAANEALGTNVRVTKIKSISSPNESAWSQSGRLDAMGNHSVTINR